MDKEEHEENELTTHEELMEIAKKLQGSLSEAFKDMGISECSVEFINISDLIEKQKPILSKPDRTETINDNDIQNLTIELNREHELDSFLERV